MVFTIPCRYKRSNLYNGVYLSLHMRKSDSLSEKDLYNCSPKECKKLVKKIVKNKLQNRSKRKNEKVFQ